MKNKNKYSKYSVHYTGDLVELNPRINIEGNITSLTFDLNIAEVEGHYGLGASHGDAVTFQGIKGKVKKNTRFWGANKVNLEVYFEDEIYIEPAHVEFLAI